MIQFKEIIMKVAIPSNDGVTISAHFGRSLGFKIFEVENGEILSGIYIKNDFTGHAQGMHQEHANHHHGHTDGLGNGQHHQHSHQGIFRAIGDVQSVIAGGMGRRLFDEFATRNISVFVTEEASIETALHKYLTNTLDSNPNVCCEH